MRLKIRYDENLKNFGFFEWNNKACIHRRAIIWVLSVRAFCPVLVTSLLGPCLVHPKSKKFLKFSITSNLAAYA